MRIVILTSRTNGNIYLVNRLTSEFNVVGKVIEAPARRSREQKKAYWRGVAKKYGVFCAINKYIYLKSQPLINSDKSNIEKQIYFEGREPEYAVTLPTLQVRNINDDEAASFIRDLNPDVICVCGTTVLQPKIFGLSSKGTINIHCGITPEYRSANPVEWAILHKDFDKIGVTIHMVDEGIDTGSILYQQVVPVEKGDLEGHLYCKAVKTGAELMIRAVKDFDEGKASTWQKTGVKGKSFYSARFGFIQYLRMKKILKRYQENLIERNN